MTYLLFMTSSPYSGTISTRNCYGKMSLHSEIQTNLASLTLTTFWGTEGPNHVLFLPWYISMSNNFAAILQLKSAYVKLFTEWNLGEDFFLIMSIFTFLRGKPLYLWFWFGSPCKCNENGKLIKLSQRLSELTLYEALSLIKGKRICLEISSLLLKNADQNVKKKKKSKKHTLVSGRKCGTFYPFPYDANFLDRPKTR